MSETSSVDVSPKSKAKDTKAKERADRKRHEEERKARGFDSKANVLGVPEQKKKQHHHRNPNQKHKGKKNASSRSVS